MSLRTRLWLVLGALFLVGVLKARVAGVSPLRSGLEVALLAAAWKRILAGPPDDGEPPSPG